MNQPAPLAGGRAGPNPYPGPSPNPPCKPGPNPDPNPNLSQELALGLALAPLVVWLQLFYKLGDFFPMVASEVRAESIPSSPSTLPSP